MKTFAVIGLWLLCTRLASGQDCATDAAVIALKNDVDFVKARVMPLMANETDEENPSLQTVMAITQTICLGKDVRARVNAIEDKVKACLRLIIAPGTGLMTLKLGGQNFFSLFQSYSDVSDYCNCTTTKASDLTAKRYELQQALDGGEDQIQEFCSNGRSKPTLEAIKTLTEQCKNLRDFAETDPILSPVFKYDTVHAYCDCVSVKALEFGSAYNMLENEVNSSAVSPGDQAGAMKVICDANSKEVLGRFMKLSKECPNLPDRMPDRLPLKFLKNYTTLEMFCDCTTTKSEEFTGLLTLLVQGTKSRLDQGDSTGAMTQLCSTDKLKPKLQRLKTLATTCLGMENRIAETALLRDVNDYETVDSFCECASSLGCMKALDIGQLTTTSQTSLWPQFPNISYVCRDPFLCAGSGVSSCRSSMKEKLKVPDASLQQVLLIQTFASRHCSAATATGTDDKLQCLMTNAESESTKKCFEKVKEARKDSDKTCAEQQCIKKLRQDCGSSEELTQVFLDGVNLYAAEQLKTTDVVCGTVTISGSVFLLLVLNLILWV